MALPRRFSNAALDEWPANFNLFYFLISKCGSVPKAYTGCPPVSRGGRRGFTIVDAVLDIRVNSGNPGANPARLPVEQPSKFQVTVNNKTAQALGLSISPTLAAQVDEIID